MNSRRSLRSVPAVLILVVLAAAGCGGSKSHGPGSASGSLRMTLVGQVNSTLYRLRNAVFQIAGPVAASIDSESNPDATVLTLVLPVGSYTIDLQDGWYMERLEGGAWVQETATLISPDPTPFTIVANATTVVTYRFDVSLGVVEIGSGTLDLTIDVTESVSQPVVFTEVLAAPSAVVDTVGEWFELYNRSAAPINLGGCTISNGGGTFTLPSVVIAAGDYLVAGRSADTSVNGGVPVDVLESLGLANVSDQLTLTCGTTVVSSVTWSSSVVGTAFQRDPASFGTSYQSAADGPGWCVATQPYGLGDLGTPGAANEACPAAGTCGATCQAVCVPVLTAAVAAALPSAVCNAPQTLTAPGVTAQTCSASTCTGGTVGCEASLAWTFQQSAGQYVATADVTETVDIAASVFGIPTSCTVDVAGTIQITVLPSFYLQGSDLHASVQSIQTNVTSFSLTGCGTLGSLLGSIEPLIEGQLATEASQQVTTYVEQVFVPCAQ